MRGALGFGSVADGARRLCGELLVMSRAGMGHLREGDVVRCLGRRKGLRT